MVRRYAPVIVALLVALGAPAAAQSPATSPDGQPLDPCLVTLDELNELSGLRFVSTAAGPSSCTYDSDPAEAFYTLDLRIEPPDPTAVEPMDALWFVRFDYDDGHDTTVGGHPAWESHDGIWVDAGDGVLVVQAILFFMTQAPDPTGFLRPIAELAVSRLPGADR